MGMEDSTGQSRGGRKTIGTVVLGPCPVPGSVLRFKKRFGVFCVYVFI